MKFLTLEKLFSETGGADGADGSVAGGGAIGIGATGAGGGSADGEVGEEVDGGGALVLVSEVGEEVGGGALVSEVGSVLLGVVVDVSLGVRMSMDSSGGADGGS